MRGKRNCCIVAMLGIALLALLTACSITIDMGGNPTAAPTQAPLASEVAAVPTATPLPTEAPAATEAAAPPEAPPPTEIPPTEAPPAAEEEPALPPAEACDAAQAAWIGTFGFGLNCLDAAGWHLYTGEDTPISDQIKDVAACSDGRAWLLHSYGLDVTDGSAWESFRNAWGFGSGEGLACDGAGGVWVAHFEGISHYDGSEWTTYPAAQLGTGKNVNLVKDVAVGPNGEVWAITANSVAAFDGQGWKVYETGKGFDKDYYFEQVAVDGQGRVWAAHGGGIWMFNGKKWVAHTSKQLSQVNSLAVDGQGRIWAGTYAHGVGVYDDKGWVAYSHAKSGISSDHVKSLAVDGRGRVWIGTQWGLNVLDGKTWHTYHMHTSGLGDNEIFTIAVAGQGPDLPPPFERAPGSLSGVLVQGTEPLRAAKVEACAEFIGMTFSGPSPCADMAFSAKAVTGDDGAFRFESLPVGRYGLAFQNAEGKWIRLSESFGLGDKQQLVNEGAETAVGTLDVSK